MSQILDLWLARKYPEQWGEPAKAKARAMMEAALGFSLSDTEKLNALESDARRRIGEQLQAQYNTEILDLFGLSAVDLFRVNDKSRHQRKAGSGRSPHTQGLMRPAVEAFMEAEKKGLNYTEAWQFAADEIQRACNAKPDAKTLRKWLDEIAGKAWSTIPPKLPPGRQPKKR